MAEAINYTLFPPGLVAETAMILQGNDAQFRCYGDYAPEAASCRTKVDYIREYAQWQSGSSGWLGFTWWAGQRFLRRRLARAGLIKPAVIPGRPTVFFQHDADRHPQNTLRLMELERDRGIVSSCYFFRRRCARWPGDEEDYDLNLAAMKALEQIGFEIGYHQNAYEQADYNEAKAWEIARDDVAFFRRHFNLRSFVPHGGKRGPSGENNHQLAHRDCFDGLLWAYDSRGLASDHVWSDGHAEHATECRLPDPRVLAARVRGRVRAIFLFHPQYYGDTLRPDWAEFAISRLPWWRSLWQLE